MINNIQGQLGLNGHSLVDITPLSTSPDMTEDKSVDNVNGPYPMYGMVS